LPEGLKVIKTEYTLSALKEALCGQEAVVCSISMFAVMEQIVFIDAAEAVGVRRFMPSDFSFREDQKQIPELEQMMAPRHAILGHLKEKAAANSNFTWTALATGQFIDWVGFSWTASD
jgi:hypothetical protein